MNEQTSLLAIEKEKEREKKERNVLAIARNMNNYIQRAEYARRMSQYRWNLQNTQTSRLSYVCQSLSIRFDLSRIRLLVYTIRPSEYVIFHGFLLSHPGFREMFISIVEMYPHFRFRRRYLGHLAQGRIYESVGENSSQIWRRIRKIQQCPTTKKKRWKLGKI